MPIFYPKLSELQYLNNDEMIDLSEEKIELLSLGAFSGILD